MSLLGKLLELLLKLICRLLGRWGLWYCRRRDLVTPVIAVDGGLVRPGEIFVDTAVEDEIGEKLRELGGRPYEPSGDGDDWRQNPLAPDYGDVNARLDEAELERHLWVGFPTRRAVRLVRKRELPGVHFNIVYIGEGVEGYYQGGPIGPAVRVTGTSNFPKYQGNGVVDVAVLDTGMPMDWKNHNSDLKDTVTEVEKVLQPDPVGTSNVVASHGGHGLFICGLIARHRPRLDIQSRRVMAVTGETDESIACEEIVKSAAAVINLSFGGYSPDGNISAIMRDAVDKAVQDDKVLVAAAGNDGGHATTSASYNKKFWPAADSQVIAVGAFDSTNNNAIAPFTNRADVYAPGVDLRSTYVTGWYDKPGGVLYQGWAKWSGTSFATPVVAAEIAAEIAIAPGVSPRQTARTWLSGQDKPGWPVKLAPSFEPSPEGRRMRHVPQLTTWPTPIPPPIP